MHSKKVLGVLLGIGLALTGVTACSNNGGQEMSGFEISNKTEYVYAPQTGSGAITVDALVASYNGNKLKASTEVTNSAKEDYVTWSIESTSDGASIDANGVVTITESFIYGDINGNDIMIKAAYFTGGEEKDSETFALHVRQPQEIASFDVDFPDSVVNGSTTKITLTNLKNQYGDAYTGVLGKAEYKSSNTGLTAENDQLTAQVKLIKSFPAAIRVSIGEVSVEKRFLVCESGYSPDATAIQALIDGESPFESVPKIYEQARDLDESKYLYVNKDLAGKSELTVTVSDMAHYQTGALYQVTYLHTDGSITQEDVTESSGAIKLSVKNCTAVEVSPVFRFTFGIPKNDVPASDINVNAKVEYDGVNYYGFYDKVENLKGAVHFKSLDTRFIFAVPNGFYNIDLIKGGDGRSLITVNDGALGCNVGIPGSGGRKGDKPYEYYMEDVNITDGSIRIGLGEKDLDLAAVEIRRSTTLRERKLHLYLAGDSTGAGYYPIETEEPASSRYQTGWGQVFQQFVTEDTVITNLGSGGTYAKSWYEIAFGGVMTHAQPGDYFIIMEGINDQSYSNVDEMVEYLSMMVEECRAKDIIPVLCTAMQSAKFWKDNKGNELSEFECPLGSGKASFMEGIRKLAKEKNVFLVDVGDITSKQYGTLGRSFVAQNYHIYNPTTQTEEDTLHLSYAGAKNVASIIATRLNELQTLGTTDANGKKVEGISFHPLTTENISYTDVNGKLSTYSVERVQSIYRKYAMK